ncbi:MAG: hypothetical protein GY861_14115 [bacterium]|nr:hypothetical protein [bacterium]
MVENNNRRSNGHLRKAVSLGTAGAMLLTQVACNKSIQTNAEINVPNREAVVSVSEQTPESINDTLEGSVRCESVNIDFGRESTKTSVHIGGRDYQLWIPTDDFQATENQPFDGRDKNNVKRVRLMAAEGATDMTIESFCFQNNFPGEKTPLENASVVIGFVAKDEINGEYHAGVKVRGSGSEEFIYSRKIDDTLTSIVVPVRFNGEIEKFNYQFKKTTDEGKTSFEIYTADPGTAGAKKSLELAVAKDKELNGYADEVMAFDMRVAWEEWMGRTGEKAKKRMSHDDPVPVIKPIGAGGDKREYTITIDGKKSVFKVTEVGAKKEYSIKSEDKNLALSVVGQEFEADSGKDMLMLKANLEGKTKYFELLMHPTVNTDAEIIFRDTSRGSVVLGGNMLFDAETEKFKPLQVKEGEDVKVFIQDIRPGRETYGNAVADWISYTIGNSSPGATRKVRNYIKTFIHDNTLDELGTTLGFNNQITKGSPILKKHEGIWEIYVGNPYSVFGTGTADLKQKEPEPIVDDSIKVGVSYFEMMTKTHSREVPKYDHANKGFDLIPGVDYKPLCRMKDGCEVSDVIDSVSNISLLDTNGRISFEKSNEPHEVIYVIKDGDKTFHRPVEARVQTGGCVSTYHEASGLDQAFCGSDITAIGKGQDKKSWCKEHKVGCGILIGLGVLGAAALGIGIGCAASGNCGSNGGGSGPGQYDTTDPTNTDRDE